MIKITPEQIDDVLPQTQCGLCGYGACAPYAEALAFDGAPINLCPPGGVKTLKKLADLLDQDPNPYLADMTQNAKPKTLAYIREKECIGCTKCIQVCPVDAILGSAKLMHTVMVDHCTGCDLCLPACPVDCIDSLPLLQEESELTSKQKANEARKHYQARAERLNVLKLNKRKAQEDVSLLRKQNYIAAAIARAKEKKR